MSEPRFLLQIVETETGAVVQMPAGGPLELDLVRALAQALGTRGVRLDQDLVAACRAAILARGVGLFRTQAHVAADIDAGLYEVFARVHAGSLPIAAPAALEASVRAVLSRLKKQLRSVV